jgi:cell pole-organizing protein PopZ
MEDVLASIRRILSEESQQPVPTVPTPADKSDGVLVLDPSMMVADERPETSADVSSQPRTEPVPETPPTVAAPEAAASAATSMGNLLRTVTTDQSLKIRPGGATIEDIVREELRLLLKDWLDAHLAETVERLVRAEIERLVGRSVA